MISLSRLIGLHRSCDKNSGLLWLWSDLVNDVRPTRGSTVGGCDGATIRSSWLGIFHAFLDYREIKLEPTSSFRKPKLSLLHFRNSSDRLTAIRYWSCVKLKRYRRLSFSRFSQSTVLSITIKFWEPLSPAHGEEWEETNIPTMSQTPVDKGVIWLVGEGQQCVLISPSYHNLHKVEMFKE